MMLPDGSCVNFGTSKVGMGWPNEQLAKDDTLQMFSHRS